MLSLKIMNFDYYEEKWNNNLYAITFYDYNQVNIIANRINNVLKVYLFRKLINLEKYKQII